MSVPSSRPVLVFDGDCGFCTSSARFLARWVLRNGAFSIAPWQQLDLAALGLTEDQCQSAVQWVGEQGQVASGHRAVAKALRAGRPVWRPIGALLLAPGFSWLASHAYSWIADHRYALPGGTPACRADHRTQPR
jgi:predicted DCC family thiol-disulfide oxidoreductase YuxK